MEELQGHHATFAFEGIYNGGNPVDIGWGTLRFVPIHQNWNHT
ncbi:hypothetical protein SFC43_25545 [Bacteroides sp. CR5/BHMF/2]|nr:hypothetical protein [Bacteroides sp. CR5/BHMF/2]